MAGLEWAPFIRNTKDLAKMLIPNNVSTAGHYGIKLTFSDDLGPECFPRSNALLAQLAEASGLGPEGSRFESEVGHGVRLNALVLTVRDKTWRMLGTAKYSMRE